MYSFSYLEPVCCSTSSSNCCFLTCIQISQEARQVVWYSHLFQNFPQFIVIHKVKSFGIVNEAEIVVFLELSCFFDDPEDDGNLISGSSAFPKTSLNISKFTVHVLLKPGLESFEHDLPSVWDACSCAVVRVYSLRYIHCCPHLCWPEWKPLRDWRKADMEPDAILAILHFAALFIQHCLVKTHFTPSLYTHNYHNLKCY